MGLISSESTCMICGSQLLDGRPIFGTFGDLGDDAAFHQECLGAWPARIGFSRDYFSACRDFLLSNGLVLIENDRWLLGCGSPPTEYPESMLGPITETSPAYLKIRQNAVRRGEPIYALVQLADWPIRLLADWEDWDVFVRSGYSEDLCGDTLAAAAAAMSEIRLHAPDLSALRALRSQRLAQQAT